KAVAVEVVDEPAGAGFRLHEAQEGDHLLMTHVVRDEAGDDAVESLAREIGIVAGKITNRRARRRFRLRGRLAAGIEVDPAQLRLDSAPRGPAGDPPKHVAATETDVEKA